MGYLLDVAYSASSCPYPSRSSQYLSCHLSLLAPGFRVAIYLMIWTQKTHRYIRIVPSQANYVRSRWC